MFRADKCIKSSQSGVNVGVKNKIHIHLEGPLDLRQLFHCFLQVALKSVRTSEDW